MKRWNYVILLLLLAGCGAQKTSEEFPPVPSAIVPKLPPLENFDLTDQEGKPFNSKSLEGKPWVASFFFTQCPAVCWRLNQALAAWQKDHPQSRIKFVSITCDPENDTPAALKKYAEHFKADPHRWTFLTGDMAYIQKLAADMFKLTVQKGTHSDRAVVIDGNRKIRGLYRVTEPDDFKKLIKLLDVVEQEQAAKDAELK